MAVGSTGLLIIPAYLETDSPVPLTAEIRLTSDVSAGIARTLTLVDVDRVAEVVPNWLVEDVLKTPAGNLATAWFGLRRGGRWAFWALLLSGLVALVYYFVISADYARQGAAWADGLMSVVEVSIPLFLGIIAGGIAFQRGLHADVSRAERRAPRISPV
jgi:hypothetical protein